MNVKLFAFARFSATSPINSICLQPASEIFFKSEAIKVLNQLRNINLQPNTRQKITTQNGNWFCYRNDRDFSHLILVNKKYPQRHAYAAISELETHLEKLISYETQPDSALRIHSKVRLSQLCVKYNDLRTLDKIMEGQARVEQIRVEMSSNINKIITNQGDLEQLGDRAAQMKNNAVLFQRNAHQLERIMYWRNCKLKILIALIVLSGLVYVIVPLVVKFSGGSGGSSGGGNNSS